MIPQQTTLSFSTLPTGRSFKKTSSEQLINCSEWIDQSRDEIAESRINDPLQFNFLLFSYIKQANATKYFYSKLDGDIFFVSLSDQPCVIDSSKVRWFSSVR